MKKINYFLAVALMGMFSFTSCENNDSATTGDTVEHADEVNEDKDLAVEEDATEFLTEAASEGMLEVQLADLAIQKATLPDVKDFAAKVKADHEKVNAEIKAIAASKNITLPAAMKENHKDKWEKLNEKTGRDFDKEYMDMMVSDHKDDVKEFQDASKDLKDAEIRNFASNQVAPLQSHLDMAQALKDRIKDMK